LSDSTQPATPKSNKFDPANLRLSQDFAATGAVAKQLVKVPVRKPRKQEWVRVRPGDDWRLCTVVLEDEIGGEVYILAPHLHDLLIDEGRAVWLFTAITKQGDLFLWKAVAPTPDGRSCDWHDTMLQAATLAEDKWVRVTANMAAGMYDVAVPVAEFDQPTWPDYEFSTLLEKAFGEKHYIEDTDHPFLQRLRGEA